MFFGDGVRGPYCEFDVGAWLGLKPDLQGGTGFNLLKVEFWTPVKETCFKKVRKWTRLKLKAVPPGGSSLGPFWLLHCGKFVEAFISSWSWLDQQQLRLESWTGEVHFCARAFSYVLRSEKGTFFPWSRDTGVQDLHWGLPPTLFHPAIFLVCCNFHLKGSRLALKPPFAPAAAKILARQHRHQLLQVQPCWDFNNCITVSSPHEPRFILRLRRARPDLAQPRSAWLHALKYGGHQKNRKEKMVMSKTQVEGASFGFVFSTWNWYDFCSSSSGGSSSTGSGSSCSSSSGK